MSNNLQEIRKERKLTQQDIAKILKTSQNQIWLYETGKRQLREEQIKILCKELQVSAGKLLGIE